MDQPLGGFIPAMIDRFFAMARYGTMAKGTNDVVNPSKTTRARRFESSFRICCISKINHLELLGYPMLTHTQATT